MSEFERKMGALQSSSKTEERSTKPKAFEFASGCLVAAQIAATSLHSGNELENENSEAAFLVWIAKVEESLQKRLVAA